MRLFDSFTSYRFLDGVQSGVSYLDEHEAYLFVSISSIFCSSNQGQEETSNPPFLGLSLMLRNQDPVVRMGPSRKHIDGETDRSCIDPSTESVCDIQEKWRAQYFSKEMFCERCGEALPTPPENALVYERCTSRLVLQTFG